MSKKVYEAVEFNIIQFDKNDIVIMSTDPVYVDPYDDEWWRKII